MVQVTIYRDFEGRPSWATVAGIDIERDKELLKAIQDGVDGLISGEINVLGFEDLEVEVV